MKLNSIFSMSLVAVGAFAAQVHAANLVVKAKSTTLSSSEYASYACEEDHLKDNAIEQCREAGYDAVPDQLAESEIKREYRTLEVHDDDDLVLIRQGWKTTCSLTGLYRCMNQSDRQAAVEAANRSVCFINAFQYGFRNKKTGYEVRMRKGRSSYSNLLKGKFNDVESALNYLNTIGPKLGCVIDRTVQ